MKYLDWTNNIDSSYNFDTEGNTNGFIMYSNQNKWDTQIGSGNGNIRIFGYDDNPAVVGSNVQNTYSEVQWLKQIVGSDEDTSWGLAVYDGKIYTHARTSSSSITIYNDSGNKVFNSLNGKNCFITKHDNLGNLIWSFKIANSIETGNGTNGGFNNKIAVDSSGLYVVGTFTTNNGGTKFYNQNGDLALTYSGNGNYVVKYNHDGVFVGVRRIIVGTSNPLSNIEIALNNSNIFVGGTWTRNETISFSSSILTNFVTQITSSSSGSDTFIACYNNSTFNLNWARKIHKGGVTQGITSDEDNVYISCSIISSNTIIYDSENTSFATLNPTNAKDNMVVCYSNSGEPQWKTILVGSDGGDNAIYDLSINSYGVYFCGFFSSSELHFKNTTKIHTI